MKRTLVIAVVAAALVMGLVAYASAETVTVTAKVNPKLVVTFDSTAIDLGASLDPGAALSGQVRFTVDSNKKFQITKSQTANLVPADATDFETDLNISWTPNFSTSTDIAKGSGQVFTDGITGAVDWDTAPGDYSADYLYTVTQN